MFMGTIICELLRVLAPNSLCLAGGVHAGVCNCVSNYSLNVYYLALSGTILGSCDASVNKTGKEPSYNGAYMGRGALRMDNLKHRIITS